MIVQLQLFNFKDKINCFNIFRYDLGRKIKRNGLGLDLEGIQLLRGP